MEIIINKIQLPDRRELTQNEQLLLCETIKYVIQRYINAKINIGNRKVEVINDANRGYPQFCPVTLNPNNLWERIYLNLKTIIFCNIPQIVYQFSHEFTHYVIYHVNPNENQKVKWIEETICEAMSLVFLHVFDKNWDDISLSKVLKNFNNDIQQYLCDCLNEKGNGRLSICCGLAELQEINQTSEEQRIDRREERRMLFYYINGDEDIKALVHYRDYVEPNTILLDTDKYRAAYPDLESVRYLCELQENAISKR